MARKTARIVTKSGSVYEMDLYNANWWLLRHNVEDFVCNQIGDIMYFYIRG